MKSKKYLLSFLYYMVAAFGVSSFNSMNVAISELTKTEVGTITTFVNLLFLIACFFIEKNKKIPEYLFMIVSFDVILKS